MIISEGKGTAMKILLFACLLFAVAGGIAGAQKKVDCPMALGPFKPEIGITAAVISAGMVPRRQNSESGRTGDRRPCRWTGTGMPAECMRRAAATINITWRTTALRGVRL